MTYLDYMMDHPDENLSWCRPYASENERVKLSYNEVRIQSLMIDGVEIEDFDPMSYDQESVWERICKASLGVETLPLYSGYSWSEIAMRDGLIECGCASCPWRTICDAMQEEIETPNELDDHPDSIFC